jgi:hypothetical protein
MLIMFSAFASALATRRSLGDADWSNGAEEMNRRRVQAARIVSSAPLTAPIGAMPSMRFTKPLAS